MDTTDPAAIAEQANNTLQWVVDLSLQYGLRVLGALLILVIGWIVARSVHSLVVKGTERAKLSVALGRFLAQFARYGVMVLAVIAMLSTVGIETTSFVAVLASAGFAFGLALQGTLGHFASGVLLLVFQPIRIGEFVGISGFDGLVQDIGLFQTVLLTPDKRTVIITNGTVTSGTIVNYTREGQRRTAIAVGVAYGSDMDQVDAVCRGIAQAHPLVLTDRPIELQMSEMGSSSVNFELRCWCKPEDYLVVVPAVRRAIYLALIENDIEIPFTQIVLHQAPTEA